MVAKKFTARHAFYVMMISLTLLHATPMNSLAACNAVTGLSTTNITNTSAKFSWSAVSCDSFLVRYFNVTSPNTIYYKIVSPGSATSVTVTGLYPNTNYSWLIRTYCNGAQSGPYQTSPATFTTQNLGTVCLVPNLTSTSNISTNSADINWNPLVSADSFLVRYHVTGTTNFAWIKLPGTQHSYTLNGLISNTGYTWMVRGLCSSSPSTHYSSANTFTTQGSNCAVPNVNLFTHSNVTATSATMGWASVTGAVSYNINYAVRYSGSWISVSSTTTSKNVSGLTPSTWYEFQVQTICSSGSSAFSGSGIFKTSASTLVLTRGPYLQLSTPNSIYIKWNTSTASDSKVYYGTTYGTYPNSATNSSSSTGHSVQLTGLSANTKYYYKIGSTSETLQGDASNYFYTNPAVGSTGTVRIWAIGDYGVGSSHQTTVRNAYDNYRGGSYTNVWLTVGDNAYSDGTDAEFTSNVFNYYSEVMKKWVFWPTTGNHDLHSATASSQSGPYFDIFTLPKTGQAGGVASGTEAYYSYNYGNIHFIALESYDASFRSTSGAMAAWLTNDLNANNQRWTVVYFHHPPYTKGSHDSDADVESIEMRTNIIPILEAHDVDLVLSGHSHCYERSYLIKGHTGMETTFASSMKVDGSSGVYPNSYMKTSPNFEGTVYVVIGSSGQVGSTSTGWPHNAMYKSTNSKYGSLAIDVSGDRLDVKFILEDGSTWDQFTMEKSGARFAGDAPENADKNVLNVFPNPANSHFTVGFTAPETTARIFVFDLNGRQLYYTELTNVDHRDYLELRIARSELFMRSGIYFVRMIADDRVLTRKLIIED